jgi:hypothetical protein
MIKVTLKVQERDDTAPSYHVAPITESGGEAWDEIDIKHGYLWVDAPGSWTGSPRPGCSPHGWSTPISVIDDGKD